MEILVISDKKLKITLTLGDMEKYSFSCEDVEVGSLGADFCAGRAFRAVLEDVRRQTGLDLSDGRLFCQVFPCKSGGCELFVTKIDVNALLSAAKVGDSATKLHDERSDDGPLDPLSGGDVTLEKQPSSAGALTAKSRRGAERFSYAYASLSALISVCRQMKLCGFHEKSSVFYDEKHYYLLFEDVDYIDMVLRSGSKISCFSVASEYGQELFSDRNNTLGSYMREHCSLLCEGDAVGTLGGV